MNKDEWQAYARKAAVFVRDEYKVPKVLLWFILFGLWGLTVQVTVATAELECIVAKKEKLLQ